MTENYISAYTAKTLSDRYPLDLIFDEITLAAKEGENEIVYQYKKDHSKWKVNDLIKYLENQNYEIVNLNSDSGVQRIKISWK